MRASAPSWPESAVPLPLPLLLPAGAALRSASRSRIRVVAAPAAASAFSVCHRRLRSRGELPDYLTALGLLGAGVEIGVRDGDFSAHLLSHWAGERLVLVDPWAAQNASLYNDVSNVAQAEQDARFALVTSTMAQRFPGRATVLREYSVAAAASFADATFDFVYVDARHDYAGVLEDLKAWWPKLRAGGLLAGHDFVPDGTHKEGVFGVQAAVAEFALGHEREVQSISDKDRDGGRAEPQHADGGWTTFYFLK